MIPYISKGGEFFGISGDYTTSKVCIFGVPFDSTTSFVPGCRFGPEIIRKVSQQIELYSLKYNVSLEDIPIYDLGDLEIIRGDAHETTKRITEVVRLLLKDKKFPVMIGGEHTITYGAVNAFPADEIIILDFDAHMDLRDSWEGNKFSHATFLRRLIEKGYRAILIGTRAVSKEELEFARNHKEQVKFFPPWKLDIKTLTESVAEKHVYISVDMDVFDPSFVPGVGTPEVGGLDFYTVLNILDKFMKQALMLDIVELTDNIRSASLASKLLSEFICGKFGDEL